MRLRYSIISGYSLRRKDVSAQGQSRRFILELFSFPEPPVPLAPLAKQAALGTRMVLECTYPGHLFVFLDKKMLYSYGICTSSKQKYECASVCTVSIGP